MVNAVADGLNQVARPVGRRSGKRMIHKQAMATDRMMAVSRGQPK